jgi:L,D-transpeptidase YbiS
MRGVLIAALGVGILVSAASGAALMAALDPETRTMEPPGQKAWPGESSEPGVTTDDLGREIARLEKKRDSLTARLARLRPTGTWLLIDTGANRIHLMRGDRTVRKAVCSTGSGTLLEDPKTGRRWVFDTPRGEFEIRKKKVDPIWVKPDWAFIEEGKPVPASFRERLEPYMLGDYALDLGDGYLIHGTLFKRSLGMSVTHGCVRVGDEDLAAIFRAVKPGTRVFII